MAEFAQFQNIRDHLTSDGWRTPESYSERHYAPILDEPAVYLFLMVERENASRAMVSYVGMSLRLRQRMIGHPIMAEINALNVWVMRWFKPTHPAVLRPTEALYITQFNPPWNIAGRPRGIA